MGSPLLHSILELVCICIMGVFSMQFDVLVVGDEDPEGGIEDEIDEDDGVDIAKPYRHEVERGMLPRRPHYSKTLRCTGPMGMDCEECTGEKNCWFTEEDDDDGVPGSWIQWYKGNGSKYTRFVKMIHVACSDSACDQKLDPTCNLTRATWRVNELVNGTFQVYFDGALCDQTPRKVATGGYVSCDSLKPNFPLTEVSGNGSTSWLKFSVANGPTGGHTIAFEFAPDEDAESSGIKVGMLATTMTNVTQKCLNNELCMNSFTHNRTGTGLDLRMHNLEQMTCLTGGDDSETCASWSACLGHTQRYWRVLHYLQAALPTNNETINELASNPRNGSNRMGKDSTPDDVECWNPSIEDYLFWECDCNSELIDYCNDVVEPLAPASVYSVAKCVRAQMCEHPRVCNSWFAQEATCLNDDIVDIRYVMGNASFLHQRASKTRKATEMFETTLSNKQCM